LYFVKNAGSLQFIPESFAKEPHLHQAFDIANEAGLSEEELEAQHRRFDFIWLQKGAIQKAKEDGHEQGMATGIAAGTEIGKQKASLAIAAQLLDILDDTTIAVKTGLSIAVVAKLRSEP
jgi:predicted transposase YdaD